MARRRCRRRLPLRLLLRLGLAIPAPRLWWPPCPARGYWLCAHRPALYRGAGRRPFVTRARYKANLTGGITMSPRRRPRTHNVPTATAHHAWPPWLPPGPSPQEEGGRPAAALARVSTATCRRVCRSLPRRKRRKRSRWAGRRCRRHIRRRQHRGRGAGCSAGVDAGGGGGGGSGVVCRTAEGSQPLVPPAGGGSSDGLSIASPPGMEARTLDDRRRKRRVL